MNKLLKSKIRSDLSKKVSEITAVSEEEITVTRKVFALEIAVAALAGLVIGMFLSPRKNVHVTVGSNNGNGCRCAEDELCGGDEDTDTDDSDIANDEFEGKYSRL